MNYEDLVMRLRKRAVDLNEKFSRNAELLSELMQAADAIEELQQTIEHYKGCSDEWYKVACDYKAMLPRWIPVTERLPEKWKWVLVCFDGADVPSTGFVNSTGDWIGEDMYTNYDVTHWMQLPEPPIQLVRNTDEFGKAEQLG